jgi:hypothetical protein
MSAEVQAAAVAPVEVERPLAAAVGLSGLRCVLTYVVVPALTPVAGVVAPVAYPVLVALAGLGIATAARAARRGFRADRIPATGVAVVLLLLNLAALASILARACA